MTATRVLNLSSGQYLCFPGKMSPRDAVIAAYAQSLKDFSTQEYEKNYSHLLEEGEHTFAIKDFASLRHPHKGAMRSA